MERRHREAEIWCGMSEMAELSAVSGSSGSNAYMLLLELRHDFADICRTGGTFTITPKALARAGRLEGWTRERYENARDVLLAAGFIEKLEAFRLSENGPQAARYALTAKGIEPVEVARVKSATLAPANTLPL